jgi:hypothetical protein
MKSQRFLGLLLIFFLSGCSGYRITYNTEPIGAAVICNGINEGYSPVKLNYSPDEDARQRGFFSTVPCRAIWSSGVTKDFSNTWDLNEFPNGVIQTLRRPSGEGYSQDAEFALKIQNMESQRRAAKAAEDAARAAEDAAYERSRPKIQQPISCFSYAGITTCN